MNLQHLAHGKGRAVTARSLWLWIRYGRHNLSVRQKRICQYGTQSVEGKPRGEVVGKNVKVPAKSSKVQKQAKAIDRDFFLSVLGSSATKRDARSYLQRFTPQKDRPSSSGKQFKPVEKSIQSSPKPGVNLGDFYSTRAVAESPKFIQQPEKSLIPLTGPHLHVALVKIRVPQHMDDMTLDGVARTLSQLGRLGLISIIVVDTDDGSRPTSKDCDSAWRELVVDQANRIADTVEAHEGLKARVLDNVVGIPEANRNQRLPAFLRGEAHVKFRKLLMTPLRRNVIPIIPTIGYTDHIQVAMPVKANDVVLALARELAGLQVTPLPDEDPILVRKRIEEVRKEVSLDRLIILDPLGGIPASDRSRSCHVFLNMQQEFETVKQELVSAMKADQLTSRRPNGHSPPKPAQRNDLLKPDQNEHSIPNSPGDQTRTEFKPSTENFGFHLRNLELVSQVLSMLPPTSSALLTTPDEAANSGRESDAPFQAAEVGTRRQKNPLIHNLLTDKPVFSPSLPTGRFGRTTPPTSNATASATADHAPTTFAKHGISVTIFPDPKVTPWEPPAAGKPNLALTDSQIDLARLVHLIEDSFDRKLDVKDYLERVNNRIAGVIIAGEYEGGALLTWELPPGIPDDGSGSARWIPYLDKFAVLKRSQGAGGVAGIVFKAMVRDCLPDGVVWRSRKDNPVNKWYFERARGTYKLPNSNWTMFFTTPEENVDRQKFLDYVSICQDIRPSWADKKAVVD